MDENRAFWSSQSKKSDYILQTW